jgi:predicted outer membrane repeat protein
MKFRSNFSRLMLLLLGGSLALLSALVLTVVLAPPHAWAQGSVIYVDKDAPGPAHNGLTWTTAYTNVQAALVAATTGNEIWVAEGVYYPDEGGGQTAGNQASSFFLKSGVGIYGGFAATETLRTQRNWNTHITVLSGDLAGNDTANAYGVVLDWENVVGTDNTYQIVTAGYYDWGSGMDVTVDATAVLDGFTITAGRDFRDAILQGIGAGVVTYKSNPTLRHLVFSGNQAKVGGGLYLWEGPTIALTDLTFTGNVATQGGGLYCRSITLTLDQFLFQSNDTRNLTAAVQSGGGMAATCSLVLTNGQFISNTAGSAGGLSTNGGPVSLSQIVFDSNRATEVNSGAGGMVSEAGNPVLTDVTFVRNSSNGWGGGYYHQNSALSLSRVSFIDNVNAWGPGGGLATVGASVIITDALFAGNRATSGPGGGLIMQANSLTMTNAVFQGNAGVPGGGLALEGVTAALRNVTVSGNQAYQGGGINLASSSLQVSNSIIYGNDGGEIQTNSNVVNAAYSIISGGCPSGATCNHVSSADPLFVLPVVPSAVPTSTGDLHLRATSPAIDAGDNSAVPSGLTTDLDGNPRLVDTPAVADTGSGTPPIVDRGAYEYQGKPELRVQKANNVGGAVAANTPFSWTLTISNTGGDTATFAANTIILQDDLPSANASYGASA